MYIVTFYSFKGGVGRTMALVNAAMELTQRGRKVLVVDFDLEAPGIPTFEPFASAATSPGVVDYISDYMKKREAPDVERYLLKCSAPTDTGELWVMPAGKQDLDYSARFNSINWQRLYDEHSGFLMFEDMKAQWKRVLAPDYVLIDSRTGHTDVGGICTRQLPDAVVLMFFPNEQNLQGLAGVAAAIRAEAEPPRGKRIALHFVPSNVPDLDDEDSILADRMARFRSSLQYENPAATIHHYNTLALLNQTIFTKNRPKSILAKEYKSLVDALISINLEDREAAISALSEIQAILGRPGREHELPIKEVEERLSRISAAHSRDGEILFRMGIVRERMANLADAVVLYTAAINANYTRPPVYTSRAQAYHLLKDDKAALLDILTVLNAEGASERELFYVARWLSEIAPERIAAIESSAAIKQLSPSGRLQVASALMSSRHALKIMEGLLRGIVEDSASTEAERDVATHRMTLVLIGSQQFKAAADLICEPGFDPHTLSRVDKAFNYAMARWGLEGEPDPALFQRLPELAIDDTRRRDPNYHQCMALAHYVLSNRAQGMKHVEMAESLLDTNPRRSMSCWRYLEVTPEEFRMDLSDIVQLLNGKKSVPVFMRGVATESSPSR